jgi:hypothetical protein
MRSSESFLVLATAAGVLLASLSPACAQEVSVTLATSADQLRACDPLFAKVILTNQGDRAARFAGPLSSEFGNIRFEYRSRDGGREAYQALPTAWQGRLGGEVPDRILRPSQSVAAYEALFWTMGKPAFREGTYELRAVAVTADAKVVRSEPVVLRVRPIGRAERDMIEEHQRLLMQLIDPVHMSGHAELPQLNRIVDALTDSELKRTLSWLLAAVVLQNTTEPVAVERRCRQLEALRKGQDPVTAEILSLVVANAYAGMGAFNDAKRVLADVPHQSDARERILSKISKMQADPRPRPVHRGIVG